MKAQNGAKRPFRAVLMRLAERAGFEPAEEV